MRSHYSVSMFQHGMFTDFFKKAAKSSSNILIVGETGTGTNTLAKCLYQINKKYSVCAFMDLSNENRIDSFAETPFIITIQEENILNALKKTEVLGIRFEYVIHIISLLEIGEIKVIKQSGREICFDASQIKESFVPRVK